MRDVVVLRVDRVRKCRLKDNIGDMDSRVKRKHTPKVGAIDDFIPFNMIKMELIDY